MIHRNKKLTANDFLTKVFKQRKAIHMSQSMISKLEAQWIKDHCNKSVGMSVDLVNYPGGYTDFLITKIHVDVEPAGNPNEPRFSIYFSFTGLFRGEGLEDKPGRTRFNVFEKQGSDEPQSKD